ncbi:hypothetical protein BP5796_00630 [Coleophoma crateriformis]|uniref:WD40 repeat-like protein n=1 Tax=Coleophoma crateriformis TaxID=565419 RepID=A0A3D8T8L7_9HELO|nr:hypothetical protein BP5796_00630 [Coleophoma crateriformis]
MADALPKSQVTDARDLDGRPLGASGSPRSEQTSHPGRPRSTTSSDGAQTPSNGKKSPVNLIRNGSSKDGTGITAKSPPPPVRTTTAIDPLSHHILKRTNTENTIPQRLRTSVLPETPTISVTSPISIEAGAPGLGKHGQPEIIRSDSNPLKEKKKGVSFLSRFSIGGKRKALGDDLDDDESELGDQRTEGMNAHVFSSSIGANGYIPQHKEPPRYIKVRAHNKKRREFNRMFLAQELSGTKHAVSDEKVPGLTTHDVTSKTSKLSKTSGAIWSTEFSRDGRYLAAAGRDQVVRVWAVISTPEERQAHEYDEDVSSAVAGGAGGERLSAPVFRTKPIREFQGHTGDILDLSWSKNNFLLSSSMDKTVRLWHISRQECLCTFKHKDFVTAIAFHPRDDRFFLAGSLDSVLRLWSIPDKSVAFWNQLPDLITAVAFAPDGKTAMAGTLNGLCMFYETEGLKYLTQIHVRSSRGRNAKGSKITGIRCMIVPPDSPDGEGDTKVLITSNDSRIRMYNMREKTLELKFRGNENTCSQISASFSDDAQYVICGSEDRKAYIWSIGPTESEHKDKRPLEYFEAHSDMVTATAMAPTQSRQLLSASGDPLYDLCNPPPVTLLSREESNASSVLATEAEKRHSDLVSEKAGEKPEGSPAYLARCTHTDGNIIITADYQGKIKVFRQDCAYNKRRSDTWETSSNFSKKMLGRSNSIMTRHSASSHSRRTSISQVSAGAPQMASDQILSWRNSVRSNDSRENSIRSGIRNSYGDRSISPGKSDRASFQPALGTQPILSSQPNLASAARQQVYDNAVVTKTAPTTTTTSPSQSLRKGKKNDSNGPSQPPAPSFSLHSASDSNDMKLDPTGKSYQFWNLQSWKNPLSSSSESSKLGSDGLTPLQRGASVVSKLSSECSSSEVGDESEGEALTCKKCGGKDFRAKKVVGRGQRLQCTKCGTAAE